MTKKRKAAEHAMGLPPDPLALDFSEVARLIVGSRSAPWLTEFLVDFNTPLWMAMALDERAPTRKEMKARNDEISRSAQALRQALDDPYLEEVFVSAGLDSVVKQHQFGVLLERTAACATKEALGLTTTKGTVRPGRGRATTADIVSQYVYCAVVIAEAWKHLQGRYPPPRNQEAQEAAALYWEQSGGLRRGHSTDKRKSWRSHFEKALKEPALPRLTAFRSEVRRNLIEAERSHSVLTAGNAAEKSTI